MHLIFHLKGIVLFKKELHMSLSKKIIIGLVLGVLVGLFFGEYCNFFSYIGDGFIGLLQMTVLPYIMVSIIANLGRMSMDEGKTMVMNGLKVLFLLLGLGVVFLVILPLALPSWSAASYFKASSIEAVPQLDLLGLYIPSNPFASMSNNVVPAVVMFSIFLGIGISKIKEKEGLLANMDVLGEGLNHINKMVVKLTPYGVFAIAAYNAGTMSFEEIQRLHAYIIIYSVAVFLLAFYWIPLLITSFTNIAPKALFKATKSTLLTIFATGKIIIVLPQLIEDIQRLMKDSITGDTEEVCNERKAQSEILMPLAYPFPNLGTFVIFVFVPFVAWFMGSSFNFSENLTFLIATSLSSFVAPVTGIPFLLDLLKLPQEMFQLFVISSVYTDRIRVVLGSVHLIALTLITIQLTVSKAPVLWKKLIKGTIIGLVLTVVLLFATRMYLSVTLGKSEQYDSFVHMEFTKDFEKFTPKNVDNLYALDSSVSSGNQISTIKERGSLRIGFLPDCLPFAFKNDNGEVLGYDIEMGYLLAKELNVTPEFYRVSKDQMKELLASGKLDIMMSGMPITTDKLAYFSFSDSYFDMTMAFLVKDHNRTNFQAKETMLQMDSLNIGCGNPYFSKKFKNYLPNANVVNLHSPRAFLKGKQNDLDAYLISAEAGAVWTIIFPSFNVVIPENDLVRVPCAYPIVNDAGWKHFVNTWIELKSKDGTKLRLFEHWIEGKGAEINEARWSIMKDVLHWNL